MNASHACSRLQTSSRSVAGSAYLKTLSLALLALALVGIITHNFASSTLPTGSSLRPPPQRTMSTVRPADVGTGVNAFGAALLAKAIQEVEPGQDCIISPWGVAHALAMLLEGVEPGSASERQLLTVVFGAAGNADAAALAAAIKTLADSLVKGDGGNDAVIVSDANSAWLAPSLSLNPAYAAALEARFNARAAPLTSAAVVNSWVAQATRNKIKTIIDDSVAAQAALVLVNAIYYKGLWEMAFSKDNTSPQPFYGVDGRSADVAMMYLNHKKGAAVQAATLSAPLPGGGGRAECIAVKLAYRGGDYAAVAAMPAGELADGSEAGTGWPLRLASGVEYSAALAACRAAVVESLASASRPLGWLPPGSPGMHAIRLSLPRFEVETSASLAPALRALGLTAPFTGGDLTRVVSGVKDLQVSEVRHKVYAKVDEAGTEAAAATAVVMVRSAMVRPQPEFVARFDRPFVFAVVHASSGLALFVGEVHSPEAWAGEP